MKKYKENENSSMIKYPNITNNDKNKFIKNNSTNNSIECVNNKGNISENNLYFAKFLFQTFNSIPYRQNYNLFINNEKEENVTLDLRVIEPIIFFNTSFIHSNNLIVGKSYCFIFYLINFDFIDIHFEFDKNSYNSFNSKKETIKIIPSEGLVKSCYRKNKYINNYINKLNKHEEAVNDFDNKNRKTNNLRSLLWLSSQDEGDSISHNSYNDNMTFDDNNKMKLLEKNEGK